MSKIVAKRLLEMQSNPQNLSTSVSINEKKKYDRWQAKFKTIDKLNNYKVHDSVKYIENRVKKNKRVQLF